MAQETEAACLLRTGASYPARLGLVSDHGPPVLVGFRAGAASMYFGDDPIFHFDLEGRWQRAFIDGVHYLKALDGTTRMLDRSREGANLVLRRRTLSLADAMDLDASARSAALEIASGLDARFERLEPPEPARPIAAEELRSFLDRVAAWDSAAWFAQRERYLGLYGPPPFLPPDAASAVLLQATLGHSGAAFGGAPASEFYRRSPSEFREHALGVARLWGRRLEQAKAVYLAGSDVWSEPIDAILDRLAAIRGVFPDRNVIGFLDSISASHSGSDAWRRLREAGLKNITLGIESGDPRIRWNEDDLSGVVSSLSEAAIDCRIVVLLAVADAEIHREHTCSFLESLPLPSGSIVYLIDASEVAPDAGIAIREDFAEGSKRFQERLKAGLKAKGVKVAIYSVEKQWS